MKKALIILTAFTLFSCGTIKKYKQSTEVKTEIDSTSKTSKETQIEGSKETKINYKTNTFTFTPFDAGTPYFVDGKEYKGGTLVIKEESKDEFTLEQYKEKIFELAEQITKLKRELNESKKIKETDNTAVFKELFFYLFILIVSLFLIALTYYHFTKPKF